ncbi:MAG TPA: tRNA (adenosine(37)-N6)-threonylcarbamoyltransferase complex dimerization subunit type 1 TsaB [Gammaproteobacteria bacterium]
MKLLAIETATEACSAALYIDGGIEQRFKIAPREHGSLILGMIDQLMAEAQLSAVQLDAIAYGRGPGSFIGVRIAAGVTQGIAFGAELPVVPVSTLAAIAQGSRHDDLLVAIDARMGEVYWGQYSRSPATGTVYERAPERLLLPDEVLVMESTAAWVGVGTGWQTYRASLLRRLPFVTQIDDNHYPKAESTAVLAAELYRQGRVVSADQVIPVYLRDRVAEKPAK